MSGISTSLSIRDRFTSTINRAAQGVDRMLRSMKALDVQTIKTSPAKVFNYASTAISKSKSRLDEFIQRQKQAAKEPKNIQEGWDGVATAIQGALAAFGASQILQLADSMTSTKARLDLMNDGLQTTEELQNRIMESANRSRASYQTTADAVSKMGIMAKDAFKSNDELIAFTELINKQFTIAGTSTAGIEAAMLQLTQAMAGGVLRGEELNSIFEQAPTIIQTIADYLNVPIGKIRSMAEEGKLTSTIVKNAMLSSADEINKKFDSMPMTFSQVWTVSMNALLEVFNPVIQAIGKGAQWLYDNWSKISPIFYGLAAAIAVYTAAMAIQTAVTWLADAANRSLITTLLKNPFLWIAIVIGVVVGMIYKWIQSVGGLKIAWMIVANALMTTWDWVKIGFFTGVYYVMDLFNKLQLGWMGVVTSVQNWAGDMKAGVLMHLQNMVNGAIDILNNLINMANKIPGVNIEVIDKVTFGASEQIENEIAKQARNRELTQYASKINNQIAERDAKLDAMKSDAKLATAARKTEIAAAQAERASKAVKDTGFKFDSTNQLKSNNIDKVGEIGKIKDDVNIAEEDLQLMKDVAEMRYVQNFVTLTPTVAMQASISEKVDVNNVIGEIERVLVEQVAASAEGHYA